MTDGVVAVDKPAGWTSHDVVAKSRGLLGTKKVGHAGTLDPSATGVLVLGVGRATRLLRYLGDLPKEYVGELVLGTETSTLDADGEVVRTHEMGAVTLDDVRRAAGGFVGPILQVPPMVSAVKVDGRAAPRAGPRRRGGRARGPAGHRPLAGRSTGTTSPGCSG